MADISQYANSIAGFGYTPETSISDQKKAAVTNAAELKKQALSGNVGAAVVGETNFANNPQLDNFLNMEPLERQLVYGSEGQALAGQFADQIDQAVTADNISRDASQIAGDSALSVAQGAVNAAGGIAGFGSGLVSPEAGNFFAENTQALSDSIGTLKSTAMTDKNNLYSRIAEMRSQDSADQYEQDVADGKSLPGLRKFGRDVMDAATDVIRDPAVLTDMTAQGIGSLGPTIAAGILSGGNPAVIAGVVGVMGAGEGYNQTQQQIMGMTDAELLETSEFYRDLRNDGVSVEDAKLRLANNTGVLAGAIAAPLATIGGRVTAEFAGNPLRVLGRNATERLESIGKTVIKEGAEEFGQGGSVQLASNIANQQLVNPDQDLMDGVAQAAVTEGLAGLGTAGVMQVPGAAIAGTVRGVASIADAAVGKATEGKQTVAQKAATTLTEAATNVSASAAVDPIEVQTENGPVPDTNAEALVQNLIRTAIIQPAEMETLPTQLLGSIDTESDLDRFSVLSTLKDKIFDEEGLSPEDGIAAVQFIQSNIQMMKEFADQGIPESIVNLGEDSDIYKEYSRAVDAAQELINSNEFNEIAQINLNEEQIEALDATTPEGADMVASVVAIDPVSVPVEKIEQAKQSTALVPVERANLDFAGELVKINDQALVRKEDLKAKYKPNEATQKRVPTDIVTEEIIDTFNNNNKLPSLKQHSLNIIQAIQKGDMPAAQLAYDDLADFVQHMQNKVEAINQSYNDAANGKQFSYRTLTPYGWLEADDSDAGKAYYNAKSGNSLYLTEAVALDAGVAADVLDSVSQAFAPLGIRPADVTRVEPVYMATAQEVAPTASTEPTNVSVEPVAINEVVPDNVSETETVPSELETTPSQETEVQREETSPAIEPVQVVEEPNLNENEINTKPIENTSAQEEPVSTETERAVSEENTAEPVEATDKTVQRENNVDSNSRKTEVAEAPKPMSLSDVSDNLNQHGQEGIDLNKNFKFNPAKTNLFAGKNPLKILGSIIRSEGDKGISARIGHTVPDDIRSVLLEVTENVLPSIVNTLNARTKSQFTDRLKVNPRLLLGRDHTNLLFVDKDTGQYPEHIAAAMAIAGYEWAINLSANGNLDYSDIAKITGVNVMDITPEMYRNFNAGVNANTAAQSIKASLAELLGFDASPDAPLVYGQNILDGLATEIIAALLESPNPLVTTRDTGIRITELADTTSQIGDIDADDATYTNSKDGFRTYKTLVSTDLKKTVAPILKGYGSALSTVLVPGRDPVIHVGKAPDAIDSVIKKNKAVKLSKRQRKALERVQNTEFKANMPMWNTLDILGRNNIAKLLGYVEVNPDNTHVGDLSSIDGKNTSIMSSLDYLDIFKAQMAGYASENNMELADVPVFFKANISRVGRIHLEGMNPQSNKYLRETIVSSEGTLDLTTEAGKQDFWLSVAQSIGEKVHKMSLVDGAARGEKVMSEGHINVAVEEVRNWLKDEKAATPESIKTFMDGFTKPMTVKDLHAIVAVAKYRNAQAEGRKALKNFSHALSLEADGITDGPLNALAHFWSEGFTQEYIELLNAGGRFLGKMYASVNDYFTTSGNQDIYEKTLNVLNQKITDNLVYGDPTNAQQAREFFQFISGLRDINITPEGVFEAKRNEIKNPETVFLYGSGIEGINDKIIIDIRDKLYEAISWALQERINQKNEKINLLDHPYFTSTNIDRATLESMFNDYFGTTADTATNKDWIMYRGNKLSDIMNTLYTEPMYRSIEEVMGSVASNMRLIIKASQVQALVAKDVFETRRDVLLQEKFGDEAFDKNDKPKPYYYGLLSPKEYASLYEEANAYAPTYYTDDATIAVSAKERALTSAVTASSSTAKFGEFKTNLSMTSMGNIGVSAAPNLNIAVGDGQMVMGIYQDDIASQGTLPVFDGIELKVSNVDELSQHINKATFDMWQKNPFNAVKEAFDTFRRIMPPLDGMSKETLISLYNATKHDKQRKIFSTTDPAGLARTIKTNLALLVNHVNETNTKIAARKSAEGKLPSYSDHMAVKAQSYNHEGEVTLSDDYATRMIEMDNLYNAERVQEAQKPIQISDALRDALINNGRAIEIGDNTIRSFTMGSLIKALRDSKSLSVEQMKLLRNLGQGTSNLSLFVGSPEALRQHKMDNGSTDTQPIVLGQYDPQTNAVYLAEANAETLLHEMIHAASFDKVNQFYTDRSAMSDIDRDAVARLEGIMNEVMSEGFWTESQYTREAIANMMDAVENAPTPAHALNEFMAYTLSNQNLAAKMAATPLRDKLLRAGRELLRFIRNLIIGRDFNVSSDVLSNIRFNLDILTSTVSGTPPDRGSWTALNQTNNQTMNQVRDSFSNKLKDLLKNRTAKLMSKRQVQERLNLINMDSRIELHRLKQAGFVMAPDEEAAFRAMFSVMATDLQLDPNALAQINKLYDHVINELSFESFMPKGSTNPNDMARAASMFDAITTTKRSFKDKQGRSVLLPKFLALSQTNEEFRNILNQIGLPKRINLEWNSVDNALNSIGSSAVDTLAYLLSAQGKEAQNVSEALDNLAQSIAQIDDESGDTLINQISKKYADFNTSVADVAQFAVKSSYNYLDSLASKSNNKAVKAFGNAAKVAISPFNNETATDAAAFITRAANTLKYVPRVAQEFWNEVQGMTLDNEGVIGLSKRAKSFVSGLRQDYREVLPKAIKGFFENPVTEGEWSTLHTWTKTDASSLLGLMTMNELFTVMRNDTDLTKAVIEAEDAVRALDKTHAPYYAQKAKELALYMVRGESSSNAILRNAEAISRRLSDNPVAVADPNIVKAVDKLISLYAMEYVSPEDKASLRDILKRDRKGMEFLLNFHQELKDAENKKVPTNHPVRINGWKGYVPSATTDNSALIVSEMDNEAKLREQGFEYVSRYQGPVPGNKRMGYFYSSSGGSPAFQQGALQNVTNTYNGVNSFNGKTVGGRTAYSINNPKLARSMWNTYKNYTGNKAEVIQPVFNDAGEVVALEVTKNPAIDNRQVKNNNLADMMGVWRGRQMEEMFAQGINDQLMKNLKEIYDQQKSTRADEFVNIATSTDPIHRDVWNSLPQELKNKIEDTFGKDTFPVRNDMINNAIGYRSASIGDIFTGNTRIRPEIQNVIKSVTSDLFGPKAVRYLINVERGAQKIVSEAKNIIVIRSVIVPVANIASNIIQLISRGVPWKLIGKTSLAKINEINQYVENRKRLINLEAKLTMVKNDPVKGKRLQAEIQSIKDAHRRMSIWPIIDQFSTIAEDLSPLDGSLKGGKWIDKIEETVDRLPAGIRTAGKYAIISRDTALYKLLNQATQYGDFIAKAVMYDHLINKGMDHDAAVREITDEFVNYDMLPGRTRTYLDSTGFTWFWNFKIRSIKIAFSMMRNNPLTAAMAMSGMGILPNLLGAGSPITDNLFGKVMDGGIYRSIGWDMLWDAPSLLPVVDTIY